MLSITINMYIAYRLHSNRGLEIIITHQHNRYFIIITTIDNCMIESKSRLKY